MTRLPHGACDTHLHVYEHRYPISPLTVLRPPDASIDDHLRSIREPLGVDRVVIVQPTTYGLDNRCQLDAAATLGEAARAVVVVDARTSHDELQRLHAAGARGARFHMLPGGAVDWDDLEPVASAVAPLGWHIQLQLDGRTLPDHADRLRRLPAPLVVDHVGRFMPPVELEHPAFGVLLELLDTGRCWVKLSAPYESTHDGRPDFPSVSRLADELVRRAPERMLWASNWPHPGQDRPLTADEIGALVERWLPTTELRRRVLVDNPCAVYGFAPMPHPEEPT